MKADDLQGELFRQFKQRLPSHVSMVDEVADLLVISADSAYRRLRGQTSLSLDEAAILAHHVGISLDGLGGQYAANVVFRSREMLPGQGLLSDFFKGIHAELERFEREPDKEVFIFAKDIPPFYLFNFPDLAAFKAFFWTTQVLKTPDLADVAVYEPEVPTDVIQAGKRVLESYCRLPSTEIWDENSTQNLLLQIAYSWESGILRDRTLARALCGQAIQLIEHMRMQATLGFKFVFGTNPAGSEGNFKLFRNDWVVGENTFLVKLGKRKLTYLNQNVLHYLFTENEAFGEATFSYLQNVMKHSSLISGFSEKERSRFFNLLMERAQRIHDSF